MLSRMFSRRHGRISSDKRHLPLNVSYVLHERSDSPAVLRACRTIARHARTTRNVDFGLLANLNGVSIDTADVTCWLTTTIGVPAMFADAVCSGSMPVVHVDERTPRPTPARLFRAEATLTLPDDRPYRVGVAAVVLRPDRRTAQLVSNGVFDWPAERDDALRALERLIQAHVDQWMPSRALWSEPAEVTLASEVY